jgi:hypothetical protein
VAAGVMEVADFFEEDDIETAGAARMIEYGIALEAAVCQWLDRSCGEEGRGRTSERSRRYRPRQGHHFDENKKGNVIQEKKRQKGGRGWWEATCSLECR